MQISPPKDFAAEQVEKFQCMSVSLVQTDDDLSDESDRCGE